MNAALIAKRMYIYIPRPNPKKLGSAREHHAALAIFKEPLELHAVISKFKPILVLLWEGL
jgi:hypothetical protein